MSLVKHASVEKKDVMLHLGDKASKTLTKYKNIGFVPLRPVKAHTLCRWQFCNSAEQVHDQALMRSVKRP